MRFQIEKKEVAMNPFTRITFERILCPTDLSEGSNEVFRYGVALARAFNAKLLACHCTDPINVADPSSRCRLEKLLKDSVREHMRIPNSFKLSWEGQVLAGDPTIAVSREAARLQANLIIIRSRRRPVAAALLGSTAETICHMAPCPVLVTHPHEHEWAGATANNIDLEQVLVACDFSPDSQRALTYGLSLAQEYEAELHLIHVLPPHSQVSTAEIAFLPVDAECRFEETARKLQSVVPKETYLWCAVKQAVREGYADKEVLDYAKENDIDLICMGASGAGSRIQEMLGSTVDRVLRQAPCPVLIVRPVEG
jgi:nucleotide-binding universal stress UspA family protein